MESNALDDGSDNLTLQADEIEALKSIYGDEWKVDNEYERCFSYTLNPKTPNEVLIQIKLPQEYPLSKPPIYELRAPTLENESRLKIKKSLEDLYLCNKGQTILYQWIETLRELIECPRNESVDDFEPLNELTVALKLEEHVSEENVCPQITTGSLIQDRKSSFQGHVARIKQVGDVKVVVNKLKENRKISNATHNIVAYRVQLPSGNIAQDYDDDGEKQAGGRLLHLLQILNVCNIVVVVSRWFGGIHLGPARFRHINNAARQVLEEANFLQNTR